MRRDTFLKSLAALAAAGTLPLSARAAGANMKMMIPANPGGGWDTTGRALGKALQEAGVGLDGELREQGRRRRRHRPGAVRQRQQGRPERPDGDGRGDARRHHHRQAAGAPGQATPIARLTERIQRLRGAGRLAVEDDEGRCRADEEGPGQRQVGRRLARLHRAHRRGDDRARRRRRPAKINYVPFRGGGEASAAILGGNVTSAAAATASSREYIEAGKMRADRRHLGHSA